jgi:hypothetical protein
MLSLAVACGVLLNLIFLIGERRVQSVIIESMEKDTSTQLSELLRTKGKEWLVNPSDLKRAQEALEELLHLIENGGHADGKIRAEIAYDDFDLTVALRYPGRLPYIASTQKLPAGMVEEQIFASDFLGFFPQWFPTGSIPRATTASARWCFISKLEGFTRCTRGTPLKPCVNERDGRFVRGRQALSL